MQVIGDAIGQCRAVIVVISPSWLNQINSPDNSFVRAEAETALDKGIPVIPLLVGGAKLPAEDQLPEQQRVLTRLNVQPLRHETFDDDMDLVRWALRLGGGLRMGDSLRMGWGAAIAAVLLVAVSLGILDQVPEDSGSPIWLAFHPAAHTAAAPAIPTPQFFQSPPNAC